MTMRSLGALTPVFLATFLAYMPFCALVHRCGCSWAWAGADSHCNAHAPLDPHCPWCEHQALGAAALLGILGGQALAFARLRRRGFSTGVSALGAAASFVVIAPVLAVLLWIPTDYPHLFGRDARARLGLPNGPVHCLPARGTIQP